MTMRESELAIVQVLRRAAMLLEKEDTAEQRARYAHLTNRELVQLSMDTLTADLQRIVDQINP